MWLAIIILGITAVAEAVWLWYETRRLDKCFSELKRLGEKHNSLTQYTLDQLEGQRKEEKELLETTKGVIEMLDRIQNAR